MNDISSSAVDKSQVFYWLIVFIIVLYCVPLIAITWEYLSNLSLESPLDPGEIKWFLAFAGGHEHSLNLIHKILMPLITFIAATSFATATSSRRTFGLAVLIFVFIFMAVAMQVAFEAHLPSEVPKVSPFFSRLEETLATYVLLILGLKMADVSSTSQRR